MAAPVRSMRRGAERERLRAWRGGCAPGGSGRGGGIAGGALAGGVWGGGGGNHRSSSGRVGTRRDEAEAPRKTTMDSNGCDGLLWYSL